MELWMFKDFMIGWPSYVIRRRATTIFWCKKTVTFFIEKSDFFQKKSKKVTFRPKSHPIGSGQRPIDRLLVEKCHFS